MSRGKFTRTDILAVLTASGLDTDKVRKITAGIIRAMAAALAAGRVIELRGLGTLEPRERKPRMRFNPRNKTPVYVPACLQVAFRPGRELKKALQNMPEIKPVL